MHHRRWTQWVLTLAAGLGLSACTNVLKEFSNDASNAAQIYAAQDALNARDYTLALSKLGGLPAEYQSRRDVILTTAAAYAGRCGLDLLGLVRSVAAQPARNLLPLLLQNFRGAGVANVADCANAEATVLRLAPGNAFSNLRADDALFTALTGLAHVGAALAAYADADHDGAADAGFDSCNASQFPDATARAVGVSINVVLAGLSAANNQTISSSVAAVAGVCAALPAGAGFCGVYDPTAFSATQIKALNGLIKSQDAPGLGTCANTLANCVCP